MNEPIDQITTWCAQQPGATSDNTFGPEADIYRIGSKIFAMVHVDSDGFVTLKADPDDSLALRQQHDFIRPGYYMNKRHWITVDLVPAVSLDLVHELIDESYALVLASLTRAKRAELLSHATE